MREQLRHKGLEEDAASITGEVANQAKDVSVCGKISCHPRHLVGY